MRSCGSIGRCTVRPQIRSRKCAELLPISGLAATRGYDASPGYTDPDFVDLTLADGDRFCSDRFPKVRG